MVKLVVLYGRPEDPDAFERYYADTHTALAKALPGLRRFEAARGVATHINPVSPFEASLCGRGRSRQLMWPIGENAAP